MKREIKFRGYSVKSEEWVYGDLIHGVGWKKGNIYILPDVVNLAYVKNCDPIDGVHVETDSIGQFTGTLDINNKEVYESDIVCIQADIMTFMRDGFTGKVRFMESGFYVDSGDDAYPVWSDAYQVEIIGNVYQNPELI